MKYVAMFAVMLLLAVPVFATGESDDSNSYAGPSGPFNDEITHFDSEGPSPTGLSWDHANDWMWHVDQGKASDLGIESMVYTVTPDGTFTERFNLQTLVETHPDFDEWTGGTNWAVGGNGCALDSANNVLYIADFNGDNTNFYDSIYVVNVSSPNSPTLIEWFDFGAANRLCGVGFIAPNEVYLSFHDGMTINKYVDRDWENPVNDYDYPVDGDFTGDFEYDVNEGYWYCGAKLSSDTVITDAVFDEVIAEEEVVGGVEHYGTALGEDSTGARAIWCTSRNADNTGEIWIFDPLDTGIEGASLGEIKANFR